VVGSAGVEWLDGGATDVPAAESELFPRAHQPPRPGEERAVRVRAPFLVDGTDPFWALFKPALAAINGLDEYPELLSQCAMIACTFVATLSRGDRHAWLRVRVADAIFAADAARRFPASAAGSLGWLLPERGSTTLARAASGGLSYYAWSAEGDIGSWAICADSALGTVMVLYGEWSFHQDDVALGHRPLAPAETDAVAAAWPAPPTDAATAS
jgi:hypothetical protein